MSTELLPTTKCIEHEEGRNTGAGLPRIDTHARASCSCANLVLRVPADKASMLSAADFERTMHRLLPEKLLADFLLDLLRAQSVPLGGREVQVVFSPMLHKVAFLIEVLAAQVATARPAEVRCAGPLVPRANDSSAGDVLAANTLLLPQQVSGDLGLPPQDVVGCQAPAK